jgi:ABC-type glutathione transport system ATPase component
MADTLTLAVRASYNDADRVHIDVDLAVHAGARTLLVGESGCGKSTVALAFVWLFRRGVVVRAGCTADGTLSLSGDPDPAQRRAWARRVGFAGAEGHLDIRRGWSVRRNIDEPLRIQQMADADRRARVDQLLHDLGLDDVADAEAATLSIGQAARVRFAQAIAPSPRWWILDEPTSGLDHNTADIIMSLVDAHTAGGGGSLIVTHDPRNVRDGDVVQVMQAGRIVERTHGAAIRKTPRHPVTAALVGHHTLTQAPAESVAGWHVDGCRLRDRCSVATVSCVATPVWQSLSEVDVRCHNPRT